MDRSWSATGRVKQLWDLVGGRDELATLTGIGGTTLSAYNTGKRKIGLGNAEKIVAAVREEGHHVSLLDLGAPELESARLDRLERRVEEVLLAVRDVLDRLDGPEEPPAAEQG